MNSPVSDKANHELQHGKLLAAENAEVAWGWGTPAGQQRARRRGQLVATAAGLGPGVRALELGCGTGLFSGIFAASGAEIIAIDISPQLLEIARANIKSVNFVCGRFEETDFAGQFDAVIGSSVLHHLDFMPTLERSLSLLRPGGVFAFAEPNFMNPQVFAERTFLRKRLRYVSPDETAFFRWSLKGRLKKAGFANITITPFDWLHPATPAGAIPWVSRVGEFLEKVPLVREFSASLLIRCEKPQLD
ncbi:MAG: class I SAM-dependent methyltransferase [Anaerolineales bacterium]